MGEWTPVLFSNRSNFQNFQPILFYHNVWHIMLTSSISIQSFQYSLSFFLCLKGRQLQFLIITSGEIWFTFKELFFQPGWLAFIYTLMKHKSSVLNISLPQVDIWNHFKGKGYHIWIWRKWKQVWKGWDLRASFLKKISIIPNVHSVKNEWQRTVVKWNLCIRCYQELWSLSR